MGFEIPSWRWAYPVAMLAATLGFVLLRKLRPIVDVERPAPGDRWRLAIAAFIGGSIGSKVPFVIASGTPFEPTVWIADGKTILAALIGAYAAVELTKRVRGIRARTGDAYALPLAGAMAIGRLGCFFTGCCFGAPTELPWGCRFVTAEGLRHPTQLYESLFHLTSAIVLIPIIERGRLATHRLQAYLIAYCGYRFLSETIRPEPIWALGLTAYQWVSLGFGLTLALQWAATARQDARRGDATAATIPLD
ncbi:MAG TPA: diacylglyceryl transferase [Planctomycetaceae bacterium]|nr:diacylglyceryl transferase [Planctomycetaceae bacterium]HRF01111.1 prolipoprotein diacylglyceryl transferase [Pirellulaceae bacterium]